MAYKLDIFDTLKKLDRRDFGYYESLTEEEKSGFVPLTALRFMSCVEGNLADWYLILANQNANIHMHKIRDHPELQMKLLATCGAGRVAPHKWVAPAPRRAGSDRLVDFFRHFWPDVNDKEVTILLKQFDHESFVDFAERSGLDSEKVAEVIEAYERHYGIKSTKATGRKGKKRKAG